MIIILILTTNYNIIIKKKNLIYILIEHHTPPHPQAPYNFHSELPTEVRYYPQSLLTDACENNRPTGGWKRRNKRYDDLATTG